MSRSPWLQKSALTLPALTLSVLVGSFASALADPPNKLVPFPEDEQTAKPVAKPAPEQTPAQPPKSDFQPRFRPPAVRQAQHAEPTKADDGDEAAEDKPAAESRVKPAAAQEPVVETSEAAAPEAGPDLPMPGSRSESPELTKAKLLFDQAFKLSKKASTEAEYTQILDNCRQCQKLNIPKNYKDYAPQLMAWAYNRRGELRAQNGDEKAALADFEASIETAAGWRAIHNRGVSRAALGQMEDALADFEKTIQLNPQYPNAYFNRGELRYREQDWAGAVSDYTAALKLGPADAAIYNSRGHAFYRMQRMGDALRDYGQAIKLEPENASALINRGDVYSDLGQYGDAASDYRAAVKVEPKLGRGYLSAAWLMSTCPDAHYRDEKLAVEAAQQAIALNGPNFRTLLTLAAAQASAGNFAEAKKTQEKAIAAAAKNEKVTAEKMMALYQREEAYRDQPITAYTRPEGMQDNQVRQASANELIDTRPPRSAQAPNGRAQRLPATGAAPQQRKQPSGRPRARI